MAAKKIKVRHIKTKKEEIITAERWGKIVSNGFSGDFQIIEEIPVPDEVKAALKPDAPKV